jgi:Fe-S-cluster containining protein
MSASGEPEAVTAAGAVGLLEGERERLTLPVLQEVERAGQRVSCRAGCSACCRQFVVVSPLEAVAIAEHVRRLEPGARRKLEEGHRRHAQALSRYPALARMLGRFRAAAGYLDAEEGDVLEKEYWGRQIACPFLVNDRCDIYAARPFACREHLALTPPELCAKDPDAVQTAPTRFEFRAVASMVGERAFRAEDRLIPVFEALRYAEARPDLRCRTAPAASILALVHSAMQRIRRFWKTIEQSRVDPS